MKLIALLILFRMLAITLVFIVPAIFGFLLIEWLEPQLFNGMFNKHILLPLPKEIPLSELFGTQKE